MLVDLVCLKSSINSVLSLLLYLKMATKELRASVVSLYRSGMCPMDIFKKLKNLGISRNFVYYTINKYNKTGSTADRPRSGRPRSVRVPNNIKLIRERLRRNPCRTQTKLALQTQMSRKSIYRILKFDLKVRAYSRRKVHYLNSRLKKMRLLKCRQLLKRHDPKNILFTDEKIFTVEEKFNRQNNKVYAKSAKEVPSRFRNVQRGHHPANLMVWWGVSYQGVTALHFCEPGVKIRAKNYQNDILEAVVKPLSTTLFKNREWVFQQDSAPSHKAKTTQKWLQDNVPNFISTEEWPASSPDLNPLDYRLWTELEVRACRKTHPNLESLKKALQREVSHFPMETVRAAIDDWIPRLKQCIKNKGGHFE